MSQLVPRIEPLGQILQPDEQRQQHPAFGVGGEHAAERERFRQEVGRQGGELGCRLLRPRLEAVDHHEGAAAGQHQAGDRQRLRQALGPFEDQHQGDRADQHAAAEGDHEMAKFLLEPAGADVLDMREPGAERYAGTGERGPQQHLDEWVHRLTTGLRTMRALDGMCG